MAKNKKKSFWKRITSSLFSKKQSQVENSARKKVPQNFHIEWKNASAKWSQFLLTKQVTQGLVVERSGYKLHKTNEKLFRLEGADFSILLATGNTLYPGKDGKISGILFVDEGNLNLAIQSDHNKLESFLSRLDLPKADMEFQWKMETTNDWRVILEWGKFWKEQLILQLSANTMALAILSIGEELKQFFESNATERQISLVRDEFFYVNHGKTGRSYSPHGKNKNIFEFGKAMTEFSEKIEFISNKREKEHET